MCVDEDESGEADASGVDDSAEVEEVPDDELDEACEALEEMSVSPSRPPSSLGLPAPVLPAWAGFPRVSVEVCGGMAPLGSFYDAAGPAALKRFVNKPMVESVRLLPPPHPCVCVCE